MKNKPLKITAIVLSTILIITLGLFALYKTSFAPKIEVSPLTTKVDINTKYLIKKFLPDNFNLSLKEVYVESTTTFTDKELTDLFILALQESKEAREFVSGLKVKIQDGKINLILHIDLNGIPLETTLTFKGGSSDGRGIFHYEGGKIGFIDIKKDWIFSNLNIEKNSIIEINKETGDIILAFDGIKQLDVRNISTFKDELNITFRGTLKFWDWLK